MNEIIKGMANASEAIQENFTEQGERLETVEQNLDFATTKFFSATNIITTYNAMRDGETRVIRAWGATIANGWPTDNSGRNVCLLIRESIEYGIAITNLGYIGMWFPTGNEFVWK